MFFQGKSLGLEIHQHGFSWVLATGSSASPVIERYETASCADEIVKPSIKVHNITDSASLGGMLSESYLKLATDTKRVSLSIPDLAGRVMMLDMDSPIKSKAEGIDQVKWKLKKSFPVELSELHLDYHLLKVSEGGVSTLLVALVSRNIITEYEELLLSLSLEPAKIDFTSFNLYQLFASRLEINEQMALVISYRGMLSVMIFQDGILDFHRSKFISAALSDPVRLYREVNSSLLVYSDSRSGWKPERLFYYAPPAERALLRSVLFEATGAEPFLVDTDAIIGSSQQKVDRALLPEILSALGAASRSLG
jgi:type IV pilus assembly protein PilM